MKLSWTCSIILYALDVLQCTKWENQLPLSPLFKMHCVWMQMPSAIDLFQSCVDYLNLNGISKMFVMSRNNPWKASIEGSSSKQSLKYRLCPSHISSLNYSVLIERKLLLNCCCQFSIAEEASQAVNRLPSRTKAISPVPFLQCIHCSGQPHLSPRSLPHTRTHLSIQEPETRLSLPDYMIDRSSWFSRFLKL